MNTALPEGDNTTKDVNLMVYMAENFATMNANIRALEKQVEKISSMQAVVTELTINAKHMRKELDDHESRIDDLERRVWYAIGAGGVIGGFVAWVAPRLLEVL